MGELWSETTHSPQPIRLTLIDLNKRAHIYQISHKNRWGKEQGIVACAEASAEMEPQQEGHKGRSNASTLHFLGTPLTVAYGMLSNMYILVCLFSICICKCLCISANTKCQQLIKQHLLECKEMEGKRRGERDTCTRAPSFTKWRWISCGQRHNKFAQN